MAGPPCCTIAALLIAVVPLAGPLLIALVALAGRAEIQVAMLRR